MGLGDQLAGYGQTALSGGLILIVILVVLAVVGGALWLYFSWKKYQEYAVVVWEFDGAGHLKQKHDVAGVFVDGKTNNKRFFMRKAGVGLTPDNIPYIDGPKGLKFVYVLRFGLKNYRFIRPEFGELYGVRMLVGEEDVNWAVNAYERQQKVFKWTTWDKFLPIIALMVVSIIILIIFIYFFKDFGVLKDVAVALKDAAIALQNAQLNTTIIPA